MSTNRPARSSNWRVNSSSIKAVEGAYILRALKKVAGAVGLPAGYRVRFTGSRPITAFDPDNQEVQIEAGDLFTKAPIPAENLDVLVGRTMHEVEHQTINTVGVWWSCLHKVPIEERRLFQKFMNIGEDIFIDHKLANNLNLWDYYEATMKKALSGRRQPNMNNLLEIWVEYALARNPSIILAIPDELTDAMQELAVLTGKLKVHMDRFSDTRVRAEYYLSSWNMVKKLVLHPPELQGSTPTSGAASQQQSEQGNQNDIDGQTQSDATDQDNADADDDFLSLMNSNHAPIDQKLADAIEGAMVSDTKDITGKIYREFEDAGFTCGRDFVVTRKHETKTLPIRPDTELCRRLEHILTIRRRLQARVMRGENHGKLDMRKLHRSQTDQRMFKLKYRFSDGFPETAILVDMSSSMSGTQAEEVIIAAASLANVVRCQIWSYTADSSEIAITRLNDGKITHRCSPEGNTPSGIALVGVADTMKKGGLIIHLTDGEHNVEFGPAEATQILNKKGINAAHLLWEQHEGLYTGLQYKILSGGLGEFPEALYWILVGQLKLEGLGKK